MQTLSENEISSSNLDSSDIITSKQSYMSEEEIHSLFS